MKSSAFRYSRVSTLQEAFDAYTACNGDKLYIAGGHSIVPSLALRLQAPEALIDISAISELNGVKLLDGVLRIGAMTRHAEIAVNPLVRKHAPLLSLAAPYVAHPAIRSRGTLGGNLANADPASEFPAVMLALDALMEIASPKETRLVPAASFFVDLFETACKPGEILTAVHIPIAGANSISAFDEIVRRRGDYAMVGCAVQGVNRHGVLKEIKIAFVSAGPKPLRAFAAEAELVGKVLTTQNIKHAQDSLQIDLDPLDDPNVPVAMRLHLARVLLGRVLGQLEVRNV